ncbi:MAG: hypothetical protein WBW88_07200 [Rhodothermales bacterium]
MRVEYHPDTVVDLNESLSGREARDILGLSRREFEEILPRYGLSILVDSPDNVDTELA